MTDRNRNRLDAAKTTFRKSTLYACPTPFFSAMYHVNRRDRRDRWSRHVSADFARSAVIVDAISDIEEEFRNRDDILQVEQPARQHLDWQRHHHQEQERADVIPRRAHLFMVRLEP